MWPIFSYAIQEFENSSLLNPIVKLCNVRTKGRNGAEKITEYNKQ